MSDCDYLSELLLEVKGQLGFATVEEVFKFLNGSGTTLIFRYKLAPFIQADSNEVPDLEQLQQLVILAISNGGTGSGTFTAMLAGMAGMAGMASNSQATENRYLASFTVLDFIMGIICLEEDSIQVVCLKAYTMLQLTHSIWRYKAEHPARDIIKDFQFLDVADTDENNEESDLQDSEDYETDEDDEEEGNASQ